MMGDMFNRKLSPSSEAIASAVGEETVILHLKDGAYYGLDAIGTQIWEGLRDGQPPLDICARMADEYDVTPEVLEADVRRLLAELEAKGLVVDPDRTDG